MIDWFLSLPWWVHVVFAVYAVSLASLAWIMYDAPEGPYDGRP
jgi:hypothetical protein